MRGRLPSLALLGLALSTAAACGGSAGTAAAPSPAASTGSTSSPGTEPRPGVADSPTPTAAPPPDPSSVHANELGLVPVLMYHQLSSHPTSDYDQTPAHFKAELETLAEEHYVPITAADLVSRRIDIPAGTHPVVLTFDDSTLSQFSLGPDGRPKPGTAVAILEQVAKEHPGFTPTATFFVNNDPFVDGNGVRALGWLHAHGFDIGDHTVDHANLRQADPAKVQQELAGNLTMIEKAVPGFTPTTMALPYGAYPRDAVLAHHGSSGGVSYDFSGVFLVGAGPSHSPYHKDFDPYHVPRIRSEQQSRASAADRNYVSGYFLPWLQAHPQDRYTSDGDPSRVSFPRSFADVLARRFAATANPY